MLTCTYFPCTHFTLLRFPGTWEYWCCSWGSLLEFQICLSSPILLLALSTVACSDFVSNMDAHIVGRGWCIPTICWALPPLSSSIHTFPKEPCLMRALWMVGHISWLIAHCFHHLSVTPWSMDGALRPANVCVTYTTIYTRRPVKATISGPKHTKKSWQGTWFLGPTSISWDTPEPFN